ncbi:rab effector MyRIP [Sagmatias obliquidens]|uniref:rab effector MyRIP n=1 Tax=Sagmatias obliquidens TaxID=3371155 RepID=UPI000F442B54|nr:rab effector MyRIP [Lagenorhynchus obliquidens]
MGRKLDLSGLTDDETEHVLQVVQRDFNLRKKEEERLSEMKQKLDEEGSKCSILSKHQKFVEHCCMRCCSPFTFLVNTKRQCGDCKFNVCKSCCSYQKHEKVWICCVCQQARVLRTQSLEWFYNNVKSRFKRFGSAKVLKNLYRKHRLESGGCFDILGGSFFDANLENEGSISGSDSTFYRQSEGHSMMDTLAVALRVAEEAIEEAISKAEAYGDSLDKQNEASYLRDHREELTEELATTILQKIIRKQKSKSEQHVEEEPEWPQPQSCSAKAADEGTTAYPGGHRASTTFWRSQSAFPLSREDALRTSSLEAASRQPRDRQPREEEALPSWKSADRLDETSNCSKQHVLGLWVSKMLLGGFSAVVWLLSPSYHQSEWGVPVWDSWVSGDLSKTDTCNEARHPQAGTDAAEEKRTNRLYELAMKMSEKETSSGEDQESEPKTESENQKESLSSEDNSQSVQEELKKKYSAVSLCNISTEVLKVINATEELIAESTGPWEFPPVPPDREKGTFPLGTDQVRLDEQLTSLEENVYLAAGTVYGLEGQLSELEDAARCIHSGTDETELADLEDQVATAAARVHHAEIQISDIESRISALTIAGLNIAPCGRLTRKRDQKQRNQVQTIDTSRQQRRKLPAPPVKAEKIEASSATIIKTFNRNFILQDSSTNRTKERKSTTKDLIEPTLESAVRY